MSLHYKSWFEGRDIYTSTCTHSLPSGHTRMLVKLFEILQRKPPRIYMYSACIIEGRGKMCRLILNPWSTGRITMNYSEYTFFTSLLEKSKDVNVHDIWCSLYGLRTWEKENMQYFSSAAVKNILAEMNWQDLPNFRTSRLIQPTFSKIYVKV